MKDEKPKNKRRERKNNHSVGATFTVSTCSQQKNQREAICNFLDIFKRLQINIPFAKTLEQIPTYAKFMKEILTKK